MDALSIAVAIAFKLVFLVLVGGGSVEVGGDTSGYLEPLDSLIGGGPYTYSLDYLPAYAGRMPGYAVIYLPLRAVLSRDAAIYGCAIIQSLLDASAAFALAALVRRLTSSRIAFALTFSVYTLSTQVSSWNHRLLTESPATSSAILATLLLARALDMRRSVDFLGAGCFWAWCVFLKPVFVVPLMLTVAALCLTKEVGIRGRQAVLILAPFFVAETLWIARNAVVLRAFIPSQYDVNAGYAHQRSLLSLVRFVQDVGGDFTSWNPRAEIRWFDEFAGRARRTPPDYSRPLFPLPPVFERSGLAMSELLETRHLVLTAVDPTRPKAERDTADRSAERRIENHRMAFARAHPVERWLVAPFRIAGLYLMQSGTTDLFPWEFASLNTWRRMFKLFQTGLFVLSVILGLPAAVLALWRFLLAPTRKHAAALAPAVCFLFFTLAFPLVMRRAEYRYMVPAYPFGIALGLIFALEGGRAWGARWAPPRWLGRAGRLTTLTGPSGR